MRRAAKDRREPDGRHWSTLLESNQRLSGVAARRLGPLGQACMETVRRLCSMPGGVRNGTVKATPDCGYCEKLERAAGIEPAIIDRKGFDATKSVVFLRK